MLILHFKIIILSPNISLNPDFAVKDQKNIENTLFLAVDAEYGHALFHCVAGASSPWTSMGKMPMPQ